jgi:hypothetical protein
MAAVKYFYIEDDTAVLFGANGTALTAVLAGASGLVSENKIDMPTLPMWMFLIGLVFAFIAKSVIMAFNDNVKQREKSQAVRDFLMEARKENEGNDAALKEIDAQWLIMESQRKLLLSAKMITALNWVRACTFFAAAICFLIGTSSIILFVSSRAS